MKQLISFGCFIALLLCCLTELSAQCLPTNNFVCNGNPSFVSRGNKPATDQWKSVTVTQTGFHYFTIYDSALGLSNTNELIYELKTCGTGKIQLHCQQYGGYVSSTATKQNADNNTCGGGAYNEHMFFTGQSCVVHILGDSCYGTTDTFTLYYRVFCKPALNKNNYGTGEWLGNVYNFSSTSHMAQYVGRYATESRNFSRSFASGQPDSVSGYCPMCPIGTLDTVKYTVQYRMRWWQGIGLYKIVSNSPNRMLLRSHGHVREIFNYTSGTIPASKFVISYIDSTATSAGNWEYEVLKDSVPFGGDMYMCKMNALTGFGDGKWNALVHDRITWPPTDTKIIDNGSNNYYQGGFATSGTVFGYNWTGTQPTMSGERCGQTMDNDSFKVQMLMKVNVPQGNYRFRVRCSSWVDLYFTSSAGNTYSGILTNSGIGSYDQTSAWYALNGIQYLALNFRHYTGNQYISFNYAHQPKNVGTVSVAVSGGTGDTVCAGSSVTLTADTVDGTQRVWYIKCTGTDSNISCANGILVGTGNSITVTPDSSTTYYVKNRNLSVAADDTLNKLDLYSAVWATRRITRVALPQDPVNGANIPLSTLSSFRYKSVCSDTAYTFVWDSVYSGSGGNAVEYKAGNSSWQAAAALGSSRWQVQLTVASGATDTIWVRSKNSTTGCVSGSVWMTGRVNPIVAVPIFVSPDTLVFIGDTLEFLATALNSSKIRYSIVAGNAQVDSITGNVTNIDSSFTIRATATDSNECGLTFKDIHVRGIDRTMCVSPLYYQSATPQCNYNEFCSLYLMKVYVHVINRTNGTGGQTYSACQGAINKLQEDFNPIGIFFQWDGSVIPHNNNVYFDNPAYNNFEVWSLQRHTDGIDIYLYNDYPYFNQTNPQPYGGGGAEKIIGTAFYMWGNYPYSPYSSYTATKILSHEMGHCFGLFHTFHGHHPAGFPNPIGYDIDANACPELVNGSNSCTCGDYITDTPADPWATGSSAPPSCQYQVSGGTPYTPDMRNIMSYGYLPCLEYFSFKQGMRMRKIIEDNTILQNCLLSTTNYTPATLIIDNNTAWDKDRYVYQNVVVKTGSTLDISGASTIVRIRKGVTITIEKGAKLVVNNARLTSMCEGMWNGIVVEGVPSQHQYAITGSGSNGTYHQGAVFLNNATIENAEKAILLGPSISKRGGFVQATGSTFRNNRNDVMMAQYRNFLPTNTGQTKPNATRFYNCNFLTVDVMQSGLPYPQNHLTMIGVNGVQIKGCEFVNNRVGQEYDYELGNGIYAVGAGFNVDDYCSTYSGGVCSNLHESRFVNLRHGIYTGSYFKNGTCRVMHTEFDHCLRSIRNEGVNFANFSGNTIAVGNTATITDITDFNKALLDEGIILRQCTGFTVEGNDIAPAKDGGNPTVELTIGIRADGTGGNYNAIRNNTFSELAYANLANRQNRADPNFDIVGLEYLCNQQADNGFDICVTAPIWNDPNNGATGVQLNQGAMNKAAGNTFTTAPEPEGNFFNQSTNLNNYFWYSSVANQEPQEFSIGSVSLFPTNSPGGCPSTTNNGTNNFIHLLATATIGELSSQYSSNHALLQTEKAALAALIDDGDTEAMLAYLEENDEADDSSDVKQTLLDASPWLSVKVLENAAQNEAAIPNHIMLQVLLANPDAIQTQTLIERLERRNPAMPQAWIDSALANKDTLTVRTYLEDSLTRHYALRNAANYEMLSRIALNEDSIDYTALRNWLDSLQSPAASMYKALTYMETDHPDTVLAKLHVVYSMSELSREDSLQVSSMDSILTYYRNWFVAQNDTDLRAGDVSSFDSATIALFDTLASKGNEHLAGTQAVRNMMNALYGRSYFTEAQLPDAAPEERRGRPENESFAAKEDKLQVKVYPNPAKDYFVVESNSDSSIVSFRVYDVYGNAVTEKKDVRFKQLTIDTKDWASGIYLWSVTALGKRGERGKISVVKW